MVALVLTTAIASGCSTYASAGVVSCVYSNGATTRTWGSNSAVVCGNGEGSPHSSADIESLGGLFDLGSTDWDNQGGISKHGDLSSWLNVSLLTGSWGDKSIIASWTLATGFWQTFYKTVFSMQVGQGSHANLGDFSAFFITRGQYTGTWSFAQNPAEGRTGGGGDLSNVDLWTAGTRSNH